MTLPALLVLAAEMPRQLVRCRDQILQRRYGANIGLPRRGIALWPRSCACPDLQVLQSHKSAHLTRGGCLYRLRIRLVKRFGLSAFVRSD